MRRTLTLLGGGPGRRLCMPTKAASSDGPWKTLKFKTRHIRHDYQNVLISGDVKKLTRTAEELLMHLNLKKSDAFWEIFSKRCKLNSNNFGPLDVAIILKAFDIHCKDTGVFTALSLTFSTHKNKMLVEMDGLSIVVLFDVFSKKLKKNSNNDLFDFLCEIIPNHMYQLSVSDLLSILTSLLRANIRNKNVCKYSARKIIPNLHFVDTTLLGRISNLFALHDYRDVNLYLKIVERAEKLQNCFNCDSIYELLYGYNRLSIDASKLLNSLNDSILSLLPKFNSVQLELLKTLVEDSNETNLDKLKTEIWKTLISENI